MANTESAKKRVRQNVKRRALNRWRMRNMRTAIKAFDKALANGELDNAASAFKTASAVAEFALWVSLRLHAALDTLRSDATRTSSRQTRRI